MRAPLLIALLVALLTGCDGLYSATASGDGTVIVVNRMTGEAKSIRGDTIVDVKPPSAPTPVPDYRPQLLEQPISDQPFVVHGVAKFRDGNLLVRVSLVSNKPNMSEAEWTQWRAHLTRTQLTASLNLQFLDDDGFAVTIKPVPLTMLTQDLGMNGKLTALEGQVEVPMTEADYKAVTGWDVGWAGEWPPYSAPSSEPKSAK